MKFDNKLVSSTAESLHLSNGQVIDMMCEVYEDAVWRTFDMDEIIYDLSINFGLPSLLSETNRPVVEKMVRFVRDEYRKHYNNTHNS